MSAQRATLVVGAGQAGLETVTALRDLGDTERLVLVGEEPVPPYDRPTLSKGYLAGSQRVSDIVFHPEPWFAQRDIELVLGDPVTVIERDIAGGRATTASGRVLEFTRLALATGSVNRRLEVPGADLETVLDLRALADADRLAAALDRLARDSARLVVIGGGFIGLEVAADARAKGVEVTVVEATDRLLGRVVSPELSDFYLGAHRRRGSEVLLGSTATRIVPDGDGIGGVELGDGRVVEAAAVLVAVGASARTELAEQLGLDIAGGIVVDEHARASDGVTVAVGDCTSLPNPYTRGAPGRLRLESAQHASDHARTAASTLAGTPAAYTSVPWFWSDQGELRLQISGLYADIDRTVVRGDPATEQFTLLHYRAGLLVAAECVGTRQDHIAVKRGLDKGMTIDPDAAADASVPLKRLLTPP
ncbi:MAG: FAD-dependent oxidoreductase [Intrasporangium sp.]|uniref:NAD(P)/FAD-dependent oxidoreductase n=1 Tax=Intrasporangium sp. TaxID=1925024 RepID=UPI0026485271|nr:FAD-dependent oxidoreductase [Intrasporangium sp.]MDN5796833.1 FAD-dependent oxidoreductase [Intrasporangium sp.]